MLDQGIQQLAPRIAGQVGQPVIDIVGMATSIENLRARYSGVQARVVGHMKGLNGRKTWRQVFHYIVFCIDGFPASMNSVLKQFVGNN